MWYPTLVDKLISANLSDFEKNCENLKKIGFRGGFVCSVR